jgi:hypothetical protein
VERLTVALERCVCGNELGRDRACPVTRSPCRCETPGPGPSVLNRQLSAVSLEHVSRRQYHERRRLGLPLLSPLERSVLRREV